MSPQNLATYPKVAGFKQLLHQLEEADPSDGIVLKAVFEHELFDDVEDIVNDDESIGSCVVLYQ